MTDVRALLVANGERSVPLHASLASEVVEVVGPDELGGLLARGQVAADLVVLDLDDESDPTAACARIVEHTGLPVVVITDAASQTEIVAPLAAGARGLVHRDSPADTVRDAVRAVTEGGLFVDPSLGATIVELAAVAIRARSGTTLTAGELRVLTRFPRGLTNRQIAEDLGISRNTVKTHVRNILRKLDARDRAQAARLAREQGLLP